MSSMSITSIRTLRLMMPISALSSSIAQTIAVVTNDWLHTVELMPNSNYEKFRMSPEMEFHKKFTVSGLWTLCYNDPPDIKMQCMQIDYFNKEEYIPDQADSTMAIPYAVKRAAIYILISSIALVLGQVIYLLSKFCGNRRIYTFISGIPFILAGLFILAGIVVYISTFKGEVSNKLRPISEFQDALFHYRYGYSFLMLVASLVLCELTGTLSIFLYISQKHFKIMIDNERDEVLKKNIIQTIRTNHKEKVDKNNVNEERPVLRIECEDDEDNDNHSTEHNLNQTSSINHNFLSPDFGVDSAFYYCGRHGTRGRRNSRSNESFLGSPRESIESRTRGNVFEINADDFSQSTNQNYNEDYKETQFSFKVTKENTKPQELNVSSLCQQRSFKSNNFDSPLSSPNSKPFQGSHKTLDVKECVENRDNIKFGELAMPYAIALSIQQLNTDKEISDQGNWKRNRLSKNKSLDLGFNRSTFV